MHESESAPEWRPLSTRTAIGLGFGAMARRILEQEAPRETTWLRLARRSSVAWDSGAPRRIRIPAIVVSP